MNPGSDPPWRLTPFQRMFAKKNSSDARQDRIHKHRSVSTPAVSHQRHKPVGRETRRLNFDANAYRSKRPGSWRQPKETPNAACCARSQHPVGDGSPPGDDSRRSLFFCRRPTGGNAFSIVPSKQGELGRADSSAGQDRLLESPLSESRTRRQRILGGRIDRLAGRIGLGRPGSRQANFRRTRIRRSGDRIAGSHA